MRKHRGYITAGTIYKEYCREFEVKPRGALVRTGKTMGLSKQRIEQVAKHFGKLVAPPKPTKMFTCITCDHELEVSYRGVARRSSCIYCEELGARKCTCGTSYFGSSKICGECRRRLAKEYTAKVKAEGGEKLKRLRAQRLEATKKSYARTRKKRAVNNGIH